MFLSSKTGVLEHMCTNIKEKTMKTELTFKIPFSGFCGTTFINCFSSTYLFLEDYVYKREERKPCGSATCDDCGYCREDGAWFFLFDTMCGHSSLRFRFDGEPTAMQKMICETDFYDGGTDNNIDFLFGFAGYEYRKLTTPGEFKAAIITSIDAGKPVIAKVKTGNDRFRVISGYDDDTLICPDYTNAQRKPGKAPAYDELDLLYVIGGKIEQRYTLIDGLNRIRQVMEYNISENLWGGYTKKMGLYTTDSLSKCNIDEKKARMKRVASAMWHTFNCHNFAEVFRKYLPFDSNHYKIYSAFDGMDKLRAFEFNALLDRISRRNGYTHDLAWALIGLEECADWTKHAAGYFGEMVELTLYRIAQNDAEVLEAIREIIRLLGVTS